MYYTFFGFILKRKSKAKDLMLIFSTQIDRTTNYILLSEEALLVQVPLVQGLRREVLTTDVQGRGSTATL